MKSVNHINLNNEKTKWIICVSFEIYIYYRSVVERDGNEKNNEIIL